MRTKRSSWGLLLLCVALTLVPVRSRAAARISVETADGTALVVINGRPALSLRTSYGGLEPVQRAGIAAKRISDMAAQGQPLAKISVKVLRHSAELRWGHQIIAYATRDEARAQDSAPARLAARWANQIKKQLSLPPVRLTTRALTIPVGEVRQASKIGASPGPFVITVDPPGIASAKLNPAGAVVVQGIKPGSGTLRVACPDGGDSIPFLVARYAGRLVEATPVAQVTGFPAPADVVGEAALRAARMDCVMEPGASPSISLTQDAKAMPEGTDVEHLAAQITITGPGYLPARIATTVELRRLLLPYRPPAVLFYSNNPEQIRGSQPLYTAVLRPDQPARLLYHHQNGSGHRLRVSVILANTSDDGAQVHLIGAAAEPESDTILVGYNAGAGFLRDLMAGAGYVLQIPPRSQVVLWTSVLDKSEAASGIMQLRQLGDLGRLVLRVLSEPAGVERSVQDVIPAEAGCYTSVYSSHQYPSPTKQLKEVYKVGDRWLFIRLGKHGISDSAEERRLDGNYGVLYTIHVTASNPTRQPKNVQVLFDATAGAAGVASFVDGQFKGKSYVEPSETVPLASYPLGPGQSREITVDTLPLAGSNYPATIVVRS